MWVLNENFISYGIMTSFSHREFTDLFIAQIFTLCQMVDFNIIWTFMIQNAESSSDNSITNMITSSFYDDCIFPKNLVTVLIKLR